MCVCMCACVCVCVCVCVCISLTLYSVPRPKSLISSVSFSVNSFGFFNVHNHVIFFPLFYVFNFFILFIILTRPSSTMLNRSSLGKHLCFFLIFLRTAFDLSVAYDVSFRIVPNALHLKDVLFFAC